MRIVECERRERDLDRTETELHQELVLVRAPVDVENTVDGVPRLGRHERGPLVPHVHPAAVGVRAIRLGGHGVDARGFVGGVQDENAAVDVLLVLLRAGEVLLVEDQVDARNLPEADFDRVGRSVHAERSASMRVGSGGDVVALASPGAGVLCEERTGAGQSWRRRRHHSDSLGDGGQVHGRKAIEVSGGWRRITVAAASWKRAHRTVILKRE